MFCFSEPNLVILAWTGDELSCGQASDWHTHTQATTIPGGQNWPRVKKKNAHGVRLGLPWAIDNCTRSSSITLNYEYMYGKLYPWEPKVLLFSISFFPGGTRGCRLEHPVCLWWWTVNHSDDSPFSVHMTIVLLVLPTALCFVSHACVG